MTTNQPTLGAEKILDTHPPCRRNAVVGAPTVRVEHQQGGGGFLVQVALWSQRRARGGRTTRRHDARVGAIVLLGTKSRRRMRRCAVAVPVLVGGHGRVRVLSVAGILGEQSRRLGRPKRARCGLGTAGRRRLGTRHLDVACLVFVVAITTGRGRQQRKLGRCQRIGIRLCFEFGNAVLEVANVFYRCLDAEDGCAR